MRRRRKNRRRFSFSPEKNLRAFSLPEIILKNISEVRNNLLFSHCSLCEEERGIFRSRTTEWPSNGDTTLRRPLCAGASEATPEKKLGQELRSGKRQNPLSQFIITAPTFQKNAFMNTAPTFAEAVIKMNTAPTWTGAKKGVGVYDPTKQRKERATFCEEQSPKDDGYTRLSYP